MRELKAPGVQDRAARKRMNPARLRTYWTLPNLSLAFVLLCCATIGLLGRFETIISILILGVILLNWNNDDFYLYTAVLLFFWDQFYLIRPSTSLFRVYTYLLLIRFVRDIGKVRFRPQFIPVLAVFACFCCVSVSRLHLRLAMTMLVDAALCYAATVYLRQNSALLRKFTMVFALTAICAGFYSLEAQTVVEYETGIGAQVSIVRYVGTLGDANFAGMYFDLAIFFALCSDAFKAWYIRWPVVGVLAYFVILTASQTALLCLLGGVCLFVLLRYRVRGIPIALLLLLGAAAGVMLLVSVPFFQQSAVFSTLANRLSQSLSDLQRSDIADLTTNRSKLWRIAWDYFLAQPWYNKLIGGSVVTMLVSEEFFLQSVGAIHQTYIQGLLDFGLIGAVIVFGTRIVQTASDAACCLMRRKTRLSEDMLRCTVMSSYTFLTYALAVDMLMDWRALFLYFL